MTLRPLAVLLALSLRSVPAFGQESPGAAPQFSDYAVTQRYRGPLYAPDFRSRPDASRFKSHLRPTAQDSIAFAGYYRVVLWGCGTQCQSGVLIDARTATIYDLPETLGAGAAYRADSRLFIVNPEATLSELYPTVDDRPTWAHPVYFLWTDSTFVALPPGAQSRRAP